MWMLCRCGIWIPILSSVSLTNESSASVRSSKGKLQLGEIRPIERTQRERRRIVIVTIISDHDLFSRTIKCSLSSTPLFVEEDRPVTVGWLVAFIKESNSRSKCKGSTDSLIDWLSPLDSLVVCVHLLVCKMLNLWHISVFV